MKKLILFATAALVTTNAYAISFEIPGVTKVVIGEGGSPLRAPSRPLDENIRMLGAAVTEVVRFGDPGRQRDKERAEAAEREARAVRDGEEKTKAEKRAGLNRSIEIATHNVHDWEDLQTQGPAVMASYDALYSAAQKELQGRLTMAADLRAAKNSAQDAGLALQMVGGLLSDRSAQKSGGQKDEDQGFHDSFDAWVANGEQLGNIAKNANMSVVDFVNRAIATADEATLQKFSATVGDTRAQIQALVKISGEKLLKARTVKEGLERELSALN